AAERQGRFAGTQIYHAHVTPEDTAAESGAQRLGAGFLGREALGVGRRPVSTPFRLVAFHVGEDAVEETRAEPLQRLLDAADVDEIAPQADDHGRSLPLAAAARAASIRRRIS